VTGSREIAIVGMACLFPAAPDLRTFWRNVVAGYDAVGDPPPHWEIDCLFDPDSSSSGRYYCKRGGYLGDLARFDPLEYGIMPKAVTGGEPDQWLALKVATDALTDAGYGDEIPERNRTAVVLGKGNYLNRGNIGVLQHGTFTEQLLHILKGLHPEYSQEDLARIRHEVKRSLPPFDADTVAALIPSVAAGRIASRLNLMGPSYTIDAACASSLIALEIASDYLLSGRCDLAIAGGVHVITPAQIRQVFCQLGELSRSQTIRPFDESADGTLVGDGVGMIVLKRLADARRDRNRIYAVIKGIGTSSDGRGMSVTAPRFEGQLMALHRAYEEAGIDPRTVGLIEAHGTGTPVGDATEIRSLSELMGPRGRPLPWCALGSVKSMLGHLMPAAGMASLIKTSLSLYHKLLPPTLNVKKPITAVHDPNCPLYINTETRPWVRLDPTLPRRAGVNAFGFGGINAHVLLEEETGPEARESLSAWDTELLLLSAVDRAGLVEVASSLSNWVEANATVSLKDLAFTMNSRCFDNSRLAIIAASVADLREKLKSAITRLSQPACKLIRDPQGVFYFENPAARVGKVAFVFPGEGSQYASMLADLCVAFPEALEAFEVFNQAFTRAGSDVLPGESVFPCSSWSEADRALAKERLWKMKVAIGSVLSADYALFNILRRIGVEPEALMGHSTGEFCALIASGVIDLEAEGAGEQFAVDLCHVYNAVPQESGELNAALVALGTDSRRVAEVIARTGGSVLIAMDNCPLQTVISGDQESVARVVAELKPKGVICETLAFDRPYHTPAFQRFAEPLHRLFKKWITRPPRIPTYSCATEDLFPVGLAEIRYLAVEQWVRPVAFRQTVEAMHRDGVRIFVEVGARGNLTSFISDTLRGKPHVALASNTETRSGISSLHFLLGMLAAHGLDLNLSYLYQRRSPQELALLSDADRVVAPRTPLTLSLDVPEMTLTDSTVFSLRRGPLSAPAPLAPSPTAAPGPQAAPETVSTSESVITAHMRIMEQFLDVQQELMSAWLVPSAAPPTGPLITRIASLTPGVRAEAVCDLDINEHIFLADHTFGRDISVTDPSLKGIPVQPFTVSMELMAETAALLRPGSVVTSFAGLRGHRWIVPETGRQILTAVAEAESPTEVKVRILMASPEELAANSFLSPAMEGHVLLSDRYPVPAPRTSVPLTGEVQSRWVRDRLYDEEMFHGPSFAGIRSIDSVAKDGLRATLAPLPRHRLLRSNPDPRFHTDPVLLDAAGQLLGFWAQHHSPDDLYFPFAVERVECFVPPVAPGSIACARLSVISAPAGALAADIELNGADGAPWIRISGWQDRRFPIPARLCRFWLAPWRAPLSDAWNAPGLILRRCDPGMFPRGFFTSAGGMWGRALTNAVLSRHEQQIFAAAKLSESQRLEWLCGRIAAKDAVCQYLREKHGLKLCPADIEIELDSNDRAEAGGAWLAHVNPAPAVSISGSGSAVIAVCAAGPGNIGIDIESMDRLEKFEAEAANLVLSKAEQHLLTALPEQERNAWHVRLRCAKEATAKALGQGISNGLPRVDSFDAGSGTVALRSEKTGYRFSSATVRCDALLVAVTVNSNHGSNQ
jgi:acyl transferase domain-containing protein/phosphopantetheinyl transferase